jgi:hypothetical protein
MIPSRFGPLGTERRPPPVLRLNYLPPIGTFDPWLDWPRMSGFRSRHPGCVGFACADGHVTFLSETINIDVYHALSTRAKGETVQVP